MEVLSTPGERGHRVCCRGPLGPEPGTLGHTCRPNWIQPDSFHAHPSPTGRLGGPALRPRELSPP